MHTFDHDKTAEAIKSFYEWYSLVCMKSELSHLIQYPPPEGWPSIPLPKLKNAGKDEAVIKLLKHIPYGPVPILYGTVPVYYHVSDDIGERGEDMLPEHPSHVFCFAQGTENQSYRILFDTKKGLFIQYSHDGTHTKLAQKPFSGEDPDWVGYGKEGSDIDNAEEPIWMEGRTCAPKQFFESIKQKYIDLEWIPDTKEEGIWIVGEAPWDGRKDIGMLNIMKRNGWGQEDRTKWNRDRALEEVEKYALKKAEDAEAETDEEKGDEENVNEENVEERKSDEKTSVATPTGAASEAHVAMILR